MNSFLIDYTKLDELGQGGFAKVYKVRHNKLGYIRAIRVLNEFIANGEKDPIYQRFLDECKILLRLGNGNHPHIVHIYQPLLKEQRALVEMDYVDGYNLTTYLESNNRFVAIGDILKLLSDMSSALSYCHEDIFKFCFDRKEDNLIDDPDDGSKVVIDGETRARLIKKYRVIHNDLHSGNIIRRNDGNYILLDFGLAIEGDSVVRSSRRRNGAPEYMAPEKWDNNSLLSTQSDIYSFGVILYEFLAGVVPFQYDKSNPNSTEAIYKLSRAHKDNEPAPIFPLRKAAYEAAYPGKIMEKPDYPEWLENLILKCLAKNPNERFTNGKELNEYVSQILATADISDISRLQEHNVALQQQVEKLQEESVSYAQALNDKIEDLKTQLHDVKRSRNRYVSRSKDLTAENDVLRKEIEELQSVTSGDDTAQLKKELDEANDTVARLNQELKIKSSSKKSGGIVWKVFTWIFLIAFVATVGLYVMSITNSVEPADSSEYRHLVAVNDSLNKHNQDLQDIIDQLGDTQVQLDDYAKQIAQRDSIIQARDSIINTNAGIVDEKEREITILEGKIKNLNRSVNSLTKRNKEFEQRILELLTN